MVGSAIELQLCIYTGAFDFEGGKTTGTHMGP